MAYKKVLDTVHTLCEHSGLAINAFKIEVQVLITSMLVDTSLLYGGVVIEVKKFVCPSNEFISTFSKLRQKRCISST